MATGKFMEKLTIIPDIHADPDLLQRCLERADHSNRIAFLGDFIDAGRKVARPDDANVLDDIQTLFASGRAVGVMGNHELNALLFHRNDVSGRPLRPHSTKNLAQHSSFCARFGIGTSEALARTSWFLTLPLWLDLGGLRLVHAYWSPRAISTIAERRPDGRLHEDDLAEIAQKETEFAKAVDLLLCGPEAPLPEGVGFHDNAGHYRTSVRIAWWRADTPTWRAAALSVPDPDAIPETPIDTISDLEFYPVNNPPVLVGHYKMRGAPIVETPQAACLDYPERPCVYQWRGEQWLDVRNLEEVAK